MSTGFCRPVPGHPSKHGANIGGEGLDHCVGPLRVKVWLPATWYMIATPGVRRKRPDTVSDPSGQRRNWSLGATSD
jgi:hypothetical protein